MGFRTTLEELIDGPAECLVFACMLLYPDVFQRLIAKVGKQHMNVDLRKSWFKGTQTQKWDQILKNSLF